MSLRSTHPGLALVCFILFTPHIFSQTNFGRISGTLTDSSNAVVPAVQVRIVNEGTGIARLVPTNESGTYVATNLPVGSYKVMVTQTGFQPEERTGLVLAADGKITVDITLQVGSSTQTVDVIAAGSEAVNLTSGELARQISSEQVQNLALNGRNYLQLSTLIPGSAVLDEPPPASTPPPRRSTAIAAFRTHCWSMEPTIWIQDRTPASSIMLA